MYILRVDHSRTYVTYLLATTKHLGTPTQSTVDWGGTRESIWFFPYDGVVLVLDIFSRELQNRRSVLCSVIQPSLYSSLVHDTSIFLHYYRRNKSDKTRWWGSFTFELRDVFELWSFITWDRWCDVRTLSTHSLWRRKMSKTPSDLHIQLSVASRTLSRLPYYVEFVYSNVILGVLRKNGAV
jgi:hypothetical protein